MSEPGTRSFWEYLYIKPSVFLEKILAANLDGIICMDDNICLTVLRILQKSRILYTFLTEQRRLPKVTMGYEVQMKTSTNRLGF